MSPVSRNVFPVVLVVLAACTPHLKPSLGPNPAEQALLEQQGSREEWIQRGDSLTARTYAVLRPFRQEMTKSKGGALRAGLTGIGIGVLSGVVVGAIGSDEAAKWIGVGTGVITTGLGIWSVYKGGRKDKITCVAAADDVIDEWAKAPKEDEASARSAYVKYHSEVRNVAEQCPELGDFGPALAAP